MLSKFSVKKPLTILVSVVAILVLGVISFTRMTTDLLPSMDLPYVAVITSCPGSGPEKVETSVTKPLEQALSTAGGVENITSVSSENSSMVLIQFAQGTNMDSAMIDLNSKITMVTGYFEDSVGAPMLLKINPDLLPIMVASADMDGKDQTELSAFLSEEVIPAFERVEGVASVSATGLTEQKLTVSLNQEKIDALNDRLLEAIDGQLADSQKELENARTELENGKAALEQAEQEQTEKLTDAQAAILSGRRQLEDGIDAVDAAISDANAQKTELSAQKAEAEAAIAQLQASGGQPTEEQLGALAQLEAGIAACDDGIAQAQTQRDSLNAQLSELDRQQADLDAGKSTITQEFTRQSVQLDQAEAELKTAEEQFESARTEAYQKAGLDGVITADTVSALLAAENFSMPAGSIADENGLSIQVKVGDNFADREELENWELFYIETGDIGGITLQDVADIEMAKTSDGSYAKINGNDGIVLSMQKQSTASTAEVSDRIGAVMEELEQKYSGLHLTALSDQGMYIDLVIQSVLQNLLMGGLLAVAILLLFLRDLRPTLLVAVSIPVSLLFALVLMYFSGVTMNIISLAGLALGVGMLVDNSIVVIENIYRLRAEGSPVKSAAIHGGMQVAGAITASTLTTICVFLPIVFTDGISRQLFTDMGLTIAYSLVASLLIALTLVPALSSGLLRHQKERKHRFFDAMVGAYRRALQFCLQRKWAALVPAAALLVLSIFGATVMGTSFIPDMDSYQLMVTMEMPAGTSREDTRAASDTLLEELAAMEDVETVGAMQSTGGSGSMLSMGGSDRSVSLYVLLREDRSRSSGEIAAQIEQLGPQVGAETLSASSGMDMSTMMGSGMDVTITGDDLDTLQQIAGDVAAMMGEIDGITDISDGTEDNTEEIRITVDKNKAMQYGLTVAQVYQSVSEALKTETSATTLSENGTDYPVVIAKDNSITEEALGDLILNGKDGTGAETEIALSEIAEINRAEALPSINRQNQTRTLSVTASVDRDHNIGLAGRELQEKLDNYTLPAGYTVELAGENETINQSLTDLVSMIALAIVLIYLIMVAQFQSLKSPFIVMFTIPLAFTGGLLALWIFGFDLSVISMLGFLVLSGVVVNNGIVFVDYANQLRQAGREKHDALLETGATRIRPILMTAMTTILGLLTLAFGMGQGAEMLQPMAVVVIGGLLYATLLTLFVVPVLYDLFNRKPLKQEE